jgi:hypothetical protein
VTNPPITTSSDAARPDGDESSGTQVFLDDDQTRNAHQEEGGEQATLE